MRALYSGISSVFVVLIALARLVAVSSAEPAAPGSKGVDARGRQAAALPPNLEAALVFEPVLKAMWQSSPTFRRQCRRLTAETGLRVRLLVEDRSSASFNARAVFKHRDGSLVSAQLYLKPAPNAAELIAHEVEHILEQLDGVDLRAQAGNGVVWKMGRGRFETGRAIEMGRRVAREITPGSDGSHTRHRRPEHNADLLATVVQHAPDATPSSRRSARVSGSGRYVVFTSLAQLVDADRNQVPDVYVLDLATGQVSLESVGAAAAPSNGWSRSPDISTDGRHVVFESVAGNLTDTPFEPGTSQVFLRDRKEELTRLVTATATGQPANGVSRHPAISADGSAVVFESTATDLLESGEVAATSFGVYLVWLGSGLRARLDATNAGRLPAINSATPAISADGRFVAFMSTMDLTCVESCSPEHPTRSGIASIYLRDTQTNTTRRITSGYAGGDPDGPSYHPAISGDGRYVAFASEATNLTRDSIKRGTHVYVHDLVTGVTEIITRTPGGRPANGPSLHPTLSHDGSTIGFQSLASDLVCQGQCRFEQVDINLLWDVFVYDRSARRMTRASADNGEEWMENSRAPSLDNSGRVLAFGSRHPINERDESHDEDLYVCRLRKGPTYGRAAHHPRSRARTSPGRIPRTKPAASPAALSLY